MVVGSHLIVNGSFCQPLFGFYTFRIIHVQMSVSLLSANRVVFCQSRLFLFVCLYTYMHKHELLQMHFQLVASCINLISFFNLFAITFFLLLFGLRTVQVYSTSHVLPFITFAPSGPTTLPLLFLHSLTHFCFYPVNPRICNLNIHVTSFAANSNPVQRRK